MAKPQDVELEKVISSLKTFAVSEDVPVEILRKTSQLVSDLLTSDAAVNFLKENPTEYHHLEVLLPIYVRIIFHPDQAVADRCFIHRNLFLEIFQSKLPGIKKESWYKNFEGKYLLKLISSLESRITANDKYWVPIWIFVTNIVVNCSLQTNPLNMLLSMTEYAFKKGKENIEILDSAWVCWVALINAFVRFPEILTPNRIMKLLLQPLRICSTVSKHRISTWAHLIKVMGPKSSQESIKSLVQPFCHALFEPPERAMSRHFPDQCTETLIEILSVDPVVEHCLPDIVGIFGACVNSKPSGGLIEQFAGAILKAINGIVDDGKSFELWKALLEQYNNCKESPILSQACQIIFSEVNFLRWVESGTVKSKDITKLMGSHEFRNRVLLRSIKELNFEEQDVTPTKKKSRKGSCEVVWSTYCEAFISWWTGQPPPKELEKSDSVQAIKDSSDYPAVQFLILQPIQCNVWNIAVSKTWIRLCEACHSQKLLHAFVKPIFDAVDEPNFQVQKAIYVADCLYRIDNSFCKKSTNLLETISSAIKSMEFQSLLDLLNLLETAVIHPEMAPVICKICKNANEKSSDYDHLSTHKIRTKVSKLTRKLENMSSAEKEKSPKTQRTPFRTQSNFLQRLAKAEEKNTSKSPFLTSILSSSEKAMNCIENGDVHLDNSVFESSEENGVSGDGDNKKPTDNSEVVPIITLPSVLKSAPVNENVVNEGIVAEKENVIIPTVATPPPASSPRLKITNAREVKTIDASSPSVPKKPKPLAGQKTTPKKVTPSKVSYFDDDANDCVMVPPKPKTTPLTEHQMEMMSKRRTDIPALYQDLSQDTQTSQPPAVIQEVTTGVSPPPIKESQDIVAGTPSPNDRAATSTPVCQKSPGKSSGSAKKLDFNGLSTPPSKLTPLSSSFRKISPEKFTSEDENFIPNRTETSNKVAQHIVDGLTDSNGQQIEPKLMDGTESQPSGQKSRKKRKSEPSKFSPKLTRSKKSLKTATPDAKISFGLPESGSTSLPESLYPPAKSLKVQGAKDPEPDVEWICPKSRNNTNESSHEDPPSPTEKKEQCDKENPVPKEDKSKSCVSQEKEEFSSHPNNEIVPSSQNTPKASEPASQGKIKKSRKRKAEESSVDDLKTSPEEDGPSAKKKNSAKKKKPLKLGAGGNLESWLVKTDRVPTPVAESGVKMEDEIVDSAAFPHSKCGTEALPEEPVVDLNNSEDIVPSTQEFVGNHKPVLPVLKTEDEGVKLEVDESRADPISNQNHSPTKSEGSVLEKLAHESPNDDIDLIISPSKRQGRAPSVFRGEGDAYLIKDELRTTTAVEPDERAKSPVRGKSKSASPVSKKKLQPAGGRSAKMLRLATGTSIPEENAGIVTPVRRRENIAPVKYGENWPKGHMEDWVACAPGSPYASPFRSALKKTPGIEENMTPKRNHDSLASPLLSSAKRKRVVFLDPPVTRGLIYELGSPCGSLHHADVPQGSPYPTWKGDDPKDDTSPSKRDAERLSSLDLKTNDTTPKQDSEDVASPIRQCTGTSLQDLKASNEVVKLLLDPSEPTEIVPSSEPDMAQFQEKHHLSNNFMTKLSDLDALNRSLLIQCFECTNMADTVDSWKLGDCRRVCQMPHAFLNSVKNSAGEKLTEILKSAVFSAPTDQVHPVLLESSTQTDQPEANSTQTNTPESQNAQSQTVTSQTKSILTNTEASPVVSTSTQADLTLPSVEDLTPILKRVGTKEALLFFSDSMRILSSLSREN